jgi:hypothetical protein
MVLILICHLPISNVFSSPGSSLKTIELSVARHSVFAVACKPFMSLTGKAVTLEVELSNLLSLRMMYLVDYNIYSGVVCILASTKSFHIVFTFS